MWPFSSTAAPVPPPQHPTDTVIPLRWVDNSPRAAWDHSFVFDHVLEPQKLRNGLDKLLQRKGWRNLGARVRLREDESLEYHVPLEYNENRPPFLFTTAKHDMSIASHPVLSKMPREQGTEPKIYQCPSEEFRHYLRHPEAPAFADDWLYKDLPQLAIHVVCFDDSTIITITMLHTLCDGMGLGTIMDAWAKSVSGNDQHIPPLVAFGSGQDDPLEYIYGSDKKTAPYVLIDRALSRWGLFLFFTWTRFQLWWWPKSETRFILVPGQFLNKLRESSQKELTKGEKAAESAPPARGKISEATGHHDASFLSRSDVLLAWWTRIIVKVLDPSSWRTVSIINLANTRDLIRNMGPLLPKNSAIMANAMFPIVTLLKARDFTKEDSQKTTAAVARHIRNALVTQRTEDQIVAQGTLIKDFGERLGLNPTYGSPGMLRVVCTNLHSGRMFDLDFSGAAVDSGKDGIDMLQRKGRPTFITFSWLEETFHLRNFLIVVGQNAEGNWWLMTRLRAQDWAGMEQEFEKLSSSHA